MRGLSVEIAVVFATRRELRLVTQILQRKKGDLAQEVNFATKNVQTEYETRTQCLRAFRQAQRFVCPVSGVDQRTVCGFFCFFALVSFFFRLHPPLKFSDK